MAVSLDVAFDNLVESIYQLKESIMEEQKNTNNRMRGIEHEVELTKGTLKIAAKNIIEML